MVYSQFICYDMTECDSEYEIYHVESDEETNQPVLNLESSNECDDFQIIIDPDEQESDSEDIVISLLSDSISFTPHHDRELSQEKKKVEGTSSSCQIIGVKHADKKQKEKNYNKKERKLGKLQLKGEIMILDKPYLIVDKEKEVNLFSELLPKKKKEVKIKQPKQLKDLEPKKVIKKFDLKRNFSLQENLNKRDKFPPIMSQVLLLNYKQYEHLCPRPIPQKFSNYQQYSRALKEGLLQELYFRLCESMKDVHNRSIPKYKIKIMGVSDRKDNLMEIKVLDFFTDRSQELKDCVNKHTLGLLCSGVSSGTQYGISNKSIKLLFSFVELGRKPRTQEQITIILKKQPFLLQTPLFRLKDQDFYILQLEKITTEAREFEALQNLLYNEYLQRIISPTDKPFEQEDITFTKQQKQSLDEIDKKNDDKYNESQYNAIKEISRKVQGLFLIQGPPGTGKTQTIMGLISIEMQKLKKYRQMFPLLRLKILMCCPSNAAVDNLIQKLQKGITTANQAIYPKILKIGVADSLEQQIKCVSFYEILNGLFPSNKQPQKSMIYDRYDELTKQVVHSKKRLLFNTKLRSVLEYLMYKLRSHEISQREIYTKTEQYLINSADIVLTTLTSSFSEKLTHYNPTFSCLIVDEAAQATEPNILIPLQYGVRKVILVGDPCQLPPTTLNPESTTINYHRSLFGRMMDCSIKPFFLDLQYRMDPIICTFPSRHFYTNRLKNSLEVVHRKKPHKLLEVFGGPAVFVAYGEYRERKKGSSFVNQLEAELIVSIILGIVAIQPELTIGVITPYAAQQREINQILVNKRRDTENKIMVSTVDSYQGQERDVILVSMVRANIWGKVGFMCDQRRINVALTRAKYLLITAGHHQTLANNSIWKQYIEHLRDELNCYHMLTNKTSPFQFSKELFGRYQSGKKKNTFVISEKSSSKKATKFIPLQ